MRIVNIADIVDNTDPQKRTFREINSDKTHQIPIETLVELDNGARLFVIQHTRDCDMTPLYSLSHEKDEYRRFDCVHGFGEESLKVIT